MLSKIGCFISKWFLFLFTVGNLRVFLNIHFEDPAGLLEVKLTKAWRFPVTGSPWSFYLFGLSRLSFEQFLNHCSGFPTQAWFRQSFLLVGSWLNKLWFFISAHLSNFGGNGLPCKLMSVMDPRVFFYFPVHYASYLLLGWS